MKKLVLDKDTLKILSPADAGRVQGGMPNPHLTLTTDCSLVFPCSGGCTAASETCGGTDLLPRSPF